MTLFIQSILAGSLLAWGHGDDVPGPHKGFVQMPGAFHTEVVPVGPRGFDVYLLDLAIQNPSVKNSSVAAKIIANGIEVEAACKPLKKKFHCQLPNGSDLKTGRLMIDASREKAQGNTATYDLPLRLNAH